MPVRIILAAALFVTVSLGCNHPPAARPAAQSPEKVLDFAVYWPPRDPGNPERPTGEPLLDAKLCFRGGGRPGDPGPATIWIELTRPSDDEHREIWNSRLAYREFDWMNRVRVWDADKKWQWPNVPYLLRAHGRQRVERYGGVDPGKGNDNDFAAVLIRAYDAAGTTELPATQNAPLVSAEWHAIGVGAADRHTIVHSARSDRFTLPIGSGVRTSGRLGVWLIYADFMGAPFPATWPRNREWAGGILAYFDVDWEIDAGGEYQVKMQQKTPPHETGFDWEAWSGPPGGDERQRAVARLSWK